MLAHLSPRVALGLSLALSLLTSAPLAAQQSVQAEQADQAAVACDALAYVVAFHAASALLAERLPYGSLPILPFEARKLGASARSALGPSPERDPTKLLPVASTQDATLTLSVGQTNVTISLPPQVRAAQARASLEGKSLVVIAPGSPTDDWLKGREASDSQASLMHILSYDISNPTKPVLKAHHELEGELVSAHRRGDHLYTVLRAPEPARAGVALAQALREQAQAQLPKAIDPELAKRWPALYDRRSFEERKRALPKLVAWISARGELPAPASLWPQASRALIGQKGQQLGSTLSCAELALPDLTSPTGLLLVSTFTLSSPSAPPMHQGVLAPSHVGADEVVSRLGADALYVAFTHESPEWLIEKPARRLLNSPQTRLLKLMLAPKTGRALLSAHLDLPGALAGPQSIAIEGEDVKVFLHGPKPKHMTLTENRARHRLEVVSELEPIKPTEPLFAVEQNAQRLYIAYGSPARVAAYDLRDPEQPRKLAEVALPSPALSLISATPSLLRVTLEGPEAKLIELDWSSPRAPKLLAQPAP